MEPAASSPGGGRSMRVSVKVEVEEFDEEDDFERIEQAFRSNEMNQDCVGNVVVDGVKEEDKKINVNNERNYLRKEVLDSEDVKSDAFKKYIEDECKPFEKQHDITDDEESIDTTLQVYNKINIHEVAVKVENDIDYDSDPEMQMVIDEEALEYSKIKSSNREAENLDLVSTDKVDTVESTNNISLSIIDCIGHNFGFFMCELCFRFYNTFKTLSTHVQTAHLYSKINFKKSVSSDGNDIIVACLNEKNYCKKCTLEFPTEIDCIRHKNKSLFDCMKCNVIYKNCRNLLDHYFSEDCTATKCQCGQKSTSYDLFIKHQKSCQSRLSGTATHSFQCIICSSVFINNQKLYIHLRKTHLGDEPLTLNKHILRRKNVFSKKAKFACWACGMQFKTKELVSAHRRPSAALLCFACGKGFVELCSLKTHICNGEGTARPQCSVCHVMFTEQKDMMSHIKAIHLNKLSVLPDSDDGGRGNENKQQPEASSSSDASQAKQMKHKPAYIHPLRTYRRKQHVQQLTYPGMRADAASSQTDAVFQATIDKTGKVHKNGQDNIKEILDRYAPGTNNRTTAEQVAVVKEEPAEYDQEMLEVLQDLRAQEDVVILDAAAVKSEQGVESVDEFIANTQEMSMPRELAEACFRCGELKRNATHVCKGHAEVKYYCKFCKEESNVFAKYLSHFQLHGFGELECPACNLRFKSLPQHIVKHVRENYNTQINFIRTRDTTPAPCGICKAPVAPTDFITHWERHILIKKNRTVVTKQIAAPYVQRKPRKQEIKPITQPDQWVVVEPQIKRPSAKHMARYESGVTGELDRYSVAQAIEYLMANKKKDKKRCHVCGKDFCRSSDYKRHLIEHLVAHIYRGEGFDGSYRCEICAEKTRDLYAFKKHLRAHAALTLYECGVCGKSFSDSSNFGKHKKVHGYPFMQCDLCARRFRSKEMIVKHMEYHMDNKPLQCRYCPRVFYFESSRKKHEKNHEMRVSLEPRPAQYRCNHCNRSFPSMRNKWNHQWVQHGIRKWKANCPYCFHAFRNYVHLRKHIQDTHRVSSTKFVFSKAETEENSEEKELIRDFVDIPYKRDEQRDGEEDMDSDEEL